MSLSSSSSSVDVCDRFQQHTWRKDTCANCLKPRKQHSSPTAISSSSSSSSSSNPQPAKRLSKAANASAAGVVVEKDETQQTVMDEGQVENNIQTEIGQVRVRQTSGQDAKRLSNVVGSPKPAPLKAKPLMVISKPEKAKKPGLVTGEKTSTAKRIIEEESLVASQDAASSISDATRDATMVVRQQDVRTMTTGDNQSDGCDVEMDREPVNMAQRTTKARTRPQVTPPQVPDPSKIPNNTTLTKSSVAKADVKTTTVKPKSSSVDALDARTKNSTSSSDSKAKSSGSHYYQIYDISAKGLSGTPEPVDVSEQNGVSEAVKRTDAKGTRAQTTAACRVVDVVEEAQNVAMPYTIVDVTVCQPNKDQLMSKAPPQLPLTPAPIRDDGAISSAPHSNTMPTTTTSRPRSTRDGSDLMRHTTPKSTHDPSSKSVLSNQSVDHVCSSEGGGPSSVRGGGTAVLPLDGKFLVGKKMANQDLYEDIASTNVINDNDKHSSASSSVNSDMNASHSATTAIVAKSSALEAKMAALSKLDLSRAIAPPGTSTLPARTDDLKTDIVAAAAAVDRQDAGETNEVKAGEIATIITLNRQEKGRKSGGKSFFQKFLKRGNKETETSQGKTSSSSALNITIEPILNTTSSSAITTTTAASAGQSSLELVVTRSSTVVVNDSPLNSSSPSKTFVNKPPLLPIASPAKKSQTTNDVSEAADSSAGSSVSSSEESSGKLAEKSTMFEQLSEKLLTDKDEFISIDTLRKLSPAKPSVDRTQSPKSIGNVILNDNASNDVVMNPTRESLTAGRDKLKSCSSLSRIPDETKQSVEEKMSFVESLRDALALKMSERDSAAGGGGKDAAAAAALDLSPTSDGTDLTLNCLNSDKCKVQKDALKPNKAPRKMMAPPPMAPPPPPPPSYSQDGVGNSSSPKHVGSIAAETDHHHATRSLSPSFHGLSSSSGGGRQTAFSLSNTLPRKSSSSSSSPSNNSTTTLKIAAGTIGLRQLDSAAKHARNKTVSEGVRFEKLLITAQEELGDEKTKNHSDDVTFACETLDRRASKFLNRALPAPPPNESPPPDLDQNCLDEIDNLYELVSQSDEPAKDRNHVVVVDEQLTYEDIDLYCTKASNGNGSKTSSTSSSQRSTSAQATNPQKVGASSSDPSALPSSNYYLEPVDGKEESDARGGGGGRGVKDDWRPCPAPRGSHHLSKVVVGVEQQTAIMSYVNTRMINGQTTLPLNTSDGFDAMAGLIVNMLYHLTDRLYTTYVTRFLKNRSDVFWTDFELRDYTPRIVLENASFYQAKHLVLAPSGCILMVTRETHHHHQGSSFSLEPMQANVISPLLCFAMTASDFETLNGSSTTADDTVSMTTTTTTTTTTSRNATVAVLLCSDVATLDNFWEREHAKVVDESTTIVFEQSVCLCLVQILNALLYLRDSGCTVLRLSSADVIMTQSSSDVKWHPLVRPSVMTFDICSDHDSAFLAEDISQLLFQMLRIESSSGKVDRQESKVVVVVVPRTRYSRGLQRVLRLFAGVQRTWEALETGRNLLEFILWGPSEEEAKFVAMTDKRDTSFRVWLEVARCRMASELVLELEKQNLELANQAKFLCRVTENSLLGVTKLLFE